MAAVLIMWIALKLFIEGAPEEGTKKEPKTMWQAMVTIIIADIVMSLDNMLAVAGASHGNNFLIIFGLVLSIPFIVFTSNLLSMLMDKYPVIVYLGAMVLGKVAGEMIITDPYVQSFLHTGKVTQYTVEAVGAIAVVVIGKLWMKNEDQEGNEGGKRNRHKLRKRRFVMAIVTISRQLGSIDKEITQSMARLWKYEYIDRRKILDDMSAKGKQWEEFGKEFDEHYPNMWERFDRSFAGFVALSQSIILNHALKDNVIIVGRGGNFLLRDVPFALNVRIVAPLEQRLEAIMKRENLSRSAAELFVKKVDKEISRAVHLYTARTSMIHPLTTCSSMSVFFRSMR